MGNRRPGGTPPRGLGAGRSSTPAVATEDAIAATPASPALAARSSSPRLRGGPGEPGLLRRSGRRNEADPSPTHETETGSSGQHNGEARLLGPSDVSASNSLSTDSDRNGNASSRSSKKRKRISARSYFQRFKMAPRGANAADLVIATMSPHLHQTGPMFPIACTTTLSPPIQQLINTQQKQGVKKLTSTPENLHAQLKQQLSKLVKVLQLPDNVRFMADQLLEFVLNNHQVVTEPVGILHAFNIALCWRAASLINCKVDRRESLALAEKSLNCECSEDLVALMYRKLRTLKDKIPYREGETNIEGQPVSVEDIRLSWQETSTDSENDHRFQNKEMGLRGKFTNGASQDISTVAEQMILARQEPVQETHREYHGKNGELPSMIVEKSIDLVGHVFSLREKNIHCKQQLEISGLVTHRQINVIRLREVCSLVLEHIRRSHIDEMTRREKIKLTAQWFSMLMYAFLEHMKLQHEKLEGLQSDTWSSERQLKENLHQVAKSGQLDQDFDQRIALPDSNFVMEEFIHFKEQNDEYRIDERSLSNCQQSSNAALLMEYTLVRNEELSEPIYIQAMENESVETSVVSRGGIASEAVDFPENIISCSSDGIGVQSAGCLSSTVPSNDDPTGQEASTSECRNTEHIKIDSIAKPSMLLGGATSLVRGVNSNNDATIDTDGNHLESPIVAASQSTTPPAQQSILGMEEASDWQPEAQPSTSMQDESEEADDEPEAVDYRISLPDSNFVMEKLIHFKEQNDAHRIIGSSVSYCQQSMQDELAESEDEPDAVDEPAEAEDELDSVDKPAEAERAASLGATAAQALQPEVQSSTSTQDVPVERTYLCGMPVLHSPTIDQSVEPSLDPHAGAEPVGMVTAHDLQSEILPSAPLPAKQNTSLLAQQSLATLQRSPAEAEPADILGTKPACDLQSSLCEVHDQPAEEQSCILGAVGARNLQPETQPSSVMPVLQSLTVHHSVQPSPDPHARAESTHTLGSLTAHVLQPEVQPSASMQDQPAEAEGAVMLGSMAAQDLQAQLQSSTTVQHAPLERIHPEERRQIGFQPNVIPGLDSPHNTL